MAKKKLEGENLKKFEELVREGKTPEDISQIFGVAVSSVHNYKRMLKEKGIEVPDVRGKRPTGFKNKPIIPLFDIESFSSKEEQESSEDYVEIEVNGVTMRISKMAKQVSIEGNRVIVKF
jgi:hypothetical protein